MVPIRSPVRYGTIPYGAVPYRSVRYGTVQYTVPICIERIVEAKGNSLEYSRLFTGGLAVDNIALHFHCENMLYCRRETYPAEVGGSDKYFAAATAKAEIWRGPLAFGVSPLVNCYNAEL
jgi:hypothetical protein